MIKLVLGFVLFLLVAVFVLAAILKLLSPPPMRCSDIPSPLAV